MIHQISTAAFVGVILFTFTFADAQNTVSVKRIPLKPLPGSQQTSPAPWMEIVRQRVILSLTPDAESGAKELAAAIKTAASLQPDGHWADLDYQSKQRSLWPTASHVHRILSMTRGFDVSRKNGKPDSALLSKIHMALEYWIKTDPQCPNWWWNQIGVPQSLGATMLILGSDADAAQRTRIIEIMKRSDWTQWTGQNLAWGTGIQVYRGLIQQDTDVVREAFERMYAEIKIASKGEEGIQPDFSFHQHGAQLYSGGYGLGFANDLGKFIAFGWDTPAQVPQHELDVFISYLLDGQRWMIYRGIFDYSAVGRELTRKGKTAVPAAATQRYDTAQGFRSTSSAFNEVVRLIAGEKGMPRRQQLATFADELDQHAVQPLKGNRHFWRSDYMSHRAPGGMFSIRMFSDRLRNTEEVNSENRKGHHLADGTTFIYRTGQEYRDIFPTWNWDRIPGTTAEQSEAGNDPNSVLPDGQKGVFGKTSFVGGVSDGQIGLAAMDLKRGALSAKKSWACVSNTIICMGAGITCGTQREVFTTINQSLHHGEVIQQRSAHNAVAIWHDGIGYIIAPDQKITLFTAERTGSWNDIGVSNQPPATNDIFTLGINHGKTPSDASYQYIVMPGISKDDFATLSSTSIARIIRNDTFAQAATLGADTFIAFWKAGEIIDGDRRISVDQPCLLLIRQSAGAAYGSVKYAISASNPENKPLKLTINFTSSTISQSASISLPDGPLAGSTATVVLGR